MDEERANINTPSLMNYGPHYWGISPDFGGIYSSSFGASVLTVTSGGGRNGSAVSNALGVRPVISLNSNAIIVAGSGSADDPWVIE